MTIAITGGTGFMGRHLARRLVDGGTEVRLISRGSGRLPEDLADEPDAELVQGSVTDEQSMADALAGCDAVAHLAGINFERGSQTYEAVHVEGTRNVVAAAESEELSRVVLSSFLRARPDCGSGYHESKWEAEEIVRTADVEHTVLKIGVVYGRGDQFVSSVARTLLTEPVFGGVGFRERQLRPLAIADLVDVLASSLVHGRLAGQTVAVSGPEELSLREAVQRIGRLIDREPLFVPVPTAVHSALGWIQELTMATPITTRAQVQMLAEGIADPAPERVCDPLPDDLRPERGFTEERVAAALPDLRRYGFADVRRFGRSDL